MCYLYFFCLHCLIAFDEGRTLPNLLGYLWSRRCPVHASESWPVFFRSIGRPFIFSAPFWMTCIAKNNISPLKCRTHFPNLRLLLVNIHIFDYPDSRLSGLFTQVPPSPDNRGSTALKSGDHEFTVLWPENYNRNSFSRRKKDRF